MLRDAGRERRQMGRPKKYRKRSMERRQRQEFEAHRRLIVEKASERASKLVPLLFVINDRLKEAGEVLEKVMRGKKR